jgi:O-antigen ligase/tetratricopeptide (TPR) repeat protein
MANRSQHALARLWERAAFFLFLCLVTILPLVHSTEAKGHFIQVKQLLFEPAVLFIFALWALSMAIEGVPRFTRSRLFLFAALFLAVCALSLVRAQPLSAAVMELRAWLAAGLAFLLAANLVNTRFRLWTVLSGLALAGLLQALIGIGQFFGFGLLIDMEGGAAATLGNSNYLGGLLAMLWFPLVAVAVIGIKASAPGLGRALSTVTALACWAAIGAGMLVTYCQSAYIGAALGFLALGAALSFRKGPSGKILAAAGLVVVLSLSAASPGTTTEKVLELDERATKGRILLWHATMLMVRDHPLLGTGIGTYPFHYLDYLSESLEGQDVKPIRRLIQFVRKPHSGYLQLWSETGSAGLLCFLGLLVLYFLGCMKLLDELRREEDRFALLGIACGQLAFTATIVVSSLLVITPLREYFWIFLGLPIGLRVAAGSDSGVKWSPAGGLRSVLIVLLAVVPLTAAIASGIDSLRIYRSSLRWQEGLAARNAGRLSDAVLLYTKALDGTNEPHELQFLRGSVLAKLAEVNPDPEMRRKLLLQGLADLKEASSGYADIRLYSNLGKSYADLGDHETSLEWYRREAATGLNYAPAHTKVGTALLALGRLEEAAAELNEALAVQPGLPWAHFNLGMARMGQGRSAEASQHFERYLAAYPDSVEGNNNLGAAYYTLRRFIDAEQRWLRALELDPDNETARDNLKLLP